MKMFFIIILLSQFYIIFPESEISQDEGPEYYCELNCIDCNSEGCVTKEHVICANFPCLPSYSCGVRHKRIPLSDTDRNLVVSIHNDLRNKAASGMEPSIGINETAANMRAISYDKELEFLAACWANQCKDSPVPDDGRDNCRATNISSQNGQSHWALALKNDTDWADPKFIEKAIQTWYGEKVNYTDDFQMYTGEHSNTFDFFTQLIWADTYLVGCGRSQFSVNDYTGVNIVCDYTPSGNIIGEPIFKFGKPCSLGKLVANNNYSGLCGEIRSLENDTYQPIFKLSSSMIGSSITVWVSVAIGQIIFFYSKWF